MLVPVIAAVLYGQVAAQPSIQADGNSITFQAPQGGVTITSRDGLVINRGSGQIDVTGQLSQLQASVSMMQSSMAEMAYAATMQSTMQSTMMAEMHDNHTAEIASLQRQVTNAVSDVTAVVAADHGTAIDQLDTRIDGQVNASTNGFNSVEARLNALEYNWWNYSEAGSIFGNGDFEDADGNAVNMSDLNSFRSSVGGAGMPIISLAEGDRPDSMQTHGKVLRYALRIGTSGCTDPDNFDCPNSYRMDTTPMTHGNFCPGTYRFSAWARVTDDFNGQDQLLHNRFYLAGGASQGWGSEPGTGVEVGAFPSSYTWQRIVVAVEVRRPAARVMLALGYPSLHTVGYMDITGVDLRRLGGDGSC